VRTIRTYILRLLVDTEEPHTLRGVIRAVADDQEQTFADGQALLTLLRRISGRADQVPAKED
jgi:hypothetical protein